MSSEPQVQAAGFLLVTTANPPKQSLQPSRFLLLRHHDRWDLPKGHQEKGESLLETALRETEEETGIAADCIRPVSDFMFAIDYQVTYEKPSKRVLNKRTTYFLGCIDCELPVVCTEHLGFEWFDWAPPHCIQSQTIDPLLSAVEMFLISQTPLR